MGIPDEAASVRHNRHEPHTLVEEVVQYIQIRSTSHELRARRRRQRYVQCVPRVRIPAASDRRYRRCRILRRIPPTPRAIAADTACVRERRGHRERRHCAGRRIRRQRRRGRLRAIHSIDRRRRPWVRRRQLPRTRPTRRPRRKLPIKRLPLPAQHLAHAARRARVARYVPLLQPERVRPEWRLDDARGRVADLPRPEEPVVERVHARHDEGLEASLHGRVPLACVLEESTLR